jgi:hypothetical protein
VLEVALQPNGLSYPPRGPQIATEKIQGAKSIAELIDVCSRTWEWRRPRRSSRQTAPAVVNNW